MDAGVEHASASIIQVRACFQYPADVFLVKYDWSSAIRVWVGDTIRVWACVAI